MIHQKGEPLMQENNSTNTFPEPITINVVGQLEIPDRIEIPGFKPIEWTVDGYDALVVKEAILELLYEGRFEIALRRTLTKESFEKFRKGMLILKSRVEVLNNGI